MKHQKSAMEKKMSITLFDNFKKLSSDWIGLGVRILISVICVAVFLILMSGIWEKYQSE
jgi:hypothetical protein